MALRARQGLVLTSLALGVHPGVIWEPRFALEGWCRQRPEVRPFLSAMK